MKTVFTILALVYSTLSFSQEKSYSHCGCLESRTESSYKVSSNNVIVDEGQFVNGKRHGQWISRDTKGNMIRKATYENGMLENDYELFFQNGKPKVKGHFNHGLPDGEWGYYNNSGKVLKSGRYNNGLPVGIWKVYTKNGKKLMAEYDFDHQKEILSTDGKQYFSNGGILKDEQSGEWMVVYQPYRDIKAVSQPVGGYLLASDMFMMNFNLPTLLMHSKNTLEFRAKIKFENGVIVDVSIDRLDKGERFDEKSGSVSYMVSTNKESKLYKEAPSPATIEFLQDQLKEFVLLAGPWTKMENGEITLQIPMVINNIKR